MIETHTHTHVQKPPRLLPITLFDCCKHTHTQINLSHFFPYLWKSKSNQEIKITDQLLRTGVSAKIRTKLI